MLGSILIWHNNSVKRRSASLHCSECQTMNPLLNSSDDEIGYEVPGNDWEKFPWEILSKEVAQIRLDILAELNLDMEADGNVQDASFLEELRIMHPSSYLPKGVTRITADIGIRFSNYGKLYTMYSSTGNIENYPVEELKKIIEAKDWKFIDASELELPYNGKNESLRKAKITWWVRFFDYL